MTAFQTGTKMFSLPVSARCFSKLVQVFNSSRIFTATTGFLWFDITLIPSLKLVSESSTQSRRLRSPSSQPFSIYSSQVTSKNDMIFCCQRYVRNSSSTKSLKMKTKCASDRPISKAMKKIRCSLLCFGSATCCNPVSIRSQSWLHLRWSIACQDTCHSRWGWI